MKKLLAILLALAVVGGVAFAQAAPGLVLSGYVSSGVKYDSSTDAVTMQNNNVSGKQARLRLNANYDNGDFGLKFRFQSNDLSAAPLITQMLVKGNLFNKMASFKVGKLDDYTYATYWNSYGSFDGVWGAMAMVKPVAGLNIGVYMPATTPGGTTVLLADSLKGIGIGVAYAADKVGNLVLGGKFFGTTKSAYVGFNFTGVENLFAELEASVPDLSTIAPAVHGQFAYTMDKLTVGTYTDDTIGTTFAWGVDPYVEYALNDMFTAGADFLIDSTNAYTATAYGYVYLGPKATLKPELSYSSTKAVVVACSVDWSF